MLHTTAHAVAFFYILADDIVSCLFVAFSVSKIVYNQMATSFVRLIITDRFTRCVSWSRDFSSSFFSSFVSCRYNKLWYWLFSIATFDWVQLMLISQTIKDKHTHSNNVARLMYFQATRDSDSFGDLLAAQNVINNISHFHFLYL